MKFLFQRKPDLAATCRIVACGALLGTSGYRATVASGASEFVPIVATSNEVASPLTTGKKRMVALSGDAALAYLYRQHRNWKTDGPDGRYYMSQAAGRVYYRDAQHRAHYVVPPKQPIIVPEDQARAFQGGYAVAIQQKNTPLSPRMSTHAAAPKAITVKTTPEAFAPLSYFAAKCARCHGPNGSFYGDTFAKTRDDASLRQIVHDMAFGPAQAPLDDPKLEVLVAYNRSLIDKKPFVSLSLAITKTLSTPQVAPKPSTPPKTVASKNAVSSPKAKSSKNTAAKTVPSKPAKPIANPKVAPKTLSFPTTPATRIWVLQGEATPDALVTLTQGTKTIEAQRSGDTWKATLTAASTASIEITAQKDGARTVIQPAQNAWSHAAPATPANAADEKAEDAASTTAASQK